MSLKTTGREQEDTVEIRTPSGKTRLAMSRFRPGQSGNPAGRPKGVPNKATAALKEILAPFDRIGIDKLKAIILDTRLLRTKPDVIVRAIELVWAYRHGKPRQQVEMTAEQGGPFDFLAFLMAAQKAGRQQEHEPAAPIPRFQPEAHARAVAEKMTAVS